MSKSEPFKNRDCSVDEVKRQVVRKSTYKVSHLVSPKMLNPYKLAIQT